MGWEAVYDTNTNLPWVATLFFVDEAIQDDEALTCGLQGDHLPLQVIPSPLVSETQLEPPTLSRPFAMTIT